MLLQPSGRAAGFGAAAGRRAVATEERTVPGALAAGTVAGFPQARQSRVFPMPEAGAESRRPQRGQGNRITASGVAADGAAAPAAGLPHLGQPPGVDAA